MSSSERIRRPPFLGPEHWRQVATIVIPVLIPLLVFLGVLWGDHAQTARNSQDIASLLAAQARHEHRLTVIEDKIGGMSVTEMSLGSKLDTLDGSVNQLTLAVQKLTDLLPERRR